MEFSKLGLWNNLKMNVKVERIKVTNTIFKIFESAGARKGGY